MSTTKALLKMGGAKPPFCLVRVGNADAVKASAFGTGVSGYCPSDKISDLGRS